MWAGAGTWEVLGMWSASSPDATMTDTKLASLLTRASTPNCPRRLPQVPQ